LREPGGLSEAYRVAAMLRRQQNLWSETAAPMLLDKIMEEAELAPAGQAQWLADSVSALGAGEGWEVRQRVVESAQPYIIEALYGRDGRIGSYGRRIIVLTKGGFEVPLRAVLLEPLFFARARSPEELRNDVHALVAQRVQNAQTASRRLCVRARCDA
jgi:hypothetical protein